MRPLPIKKNMHQVRRELLTEFQTAFYHLYRDLLDYGSFGTHASGRITIRWKNEQAKKAILNFVSFIIRKVKKEPEYYCKNDYKKLRQYLGMLDYKLGESYKEAVELYPDLVLQNRTQERVNITFILVCRLVDKGVRRALLPYDKRPKMNSCDLPAWGWGEWGHGYYC